MSRTPVRPARRRARLLTGVALVGVLGAGALSGCSVSESDLRPGTAAQVGSEEISLSEVDAAASGVCTSLDAAAEQPVPAGQTAPQPVAGSAVRTSLLEGLVLRSLGDQLRQDLDVDSTASYAAQLSQAEQVYGEDEDVLPAVTGASYFTDLTIEIGRISLGLDEITQATAQQAFEEGQSVVAGRLEGIDIETNPIFPRLTLADNPIQGDQLVYFDRDASTSDLSVAVSDQAVAAQDGTSPEQLAELTDSQICG